MAFHWAEFARIAAVVMTSSPTAHLRSLRGTRTQPDLAWELERSSDLSLRITNRTGATAYDVRASTGEQWESDPCRDGPWAPLPAGRSIVSYLRFPGNADAGQVFISWSSAPHGRRQTWHGPNPSGHRPPPPAAD